MKHLKDKQSERRVTEVRREGDKRRKGRQTIYNENRLNGLRATETHVWI